MRGRLALAVVSSACGRLHFDPLLDTAPDAVATPRCDPMAPFTSVVRIAELDAPSATDGAIRLSADERIAHFHSQRGGLFEIWTASRADRDQPFGPATRAFSDGTIGYWPTVTADGLTIVFSDASDDLQIATRGSDAQPFASPTVVAALSTANMENTPYLLSDGNLYFTRYTPAATVYVVEGWPTLQTAVIVNGLDASAPEERAAVISEDARSLYFSTGQDIYVSTRADAQSAFGVAAPVADVNTANAEAPTWLSPDGCRLYFESVRTGDYALHVAERVP